MRKTATAAVLTENALDAFFANERSRLEAQRRAEDLKKKNEATRELIIDHVRKHGGADRTTVRFGYRLALVDGQRRPDWKGELLTIVGEDRLEEIRQATEPSESLIVELAGK